MKHPASNWAHDKQASNGEAELSYLGQGFSLITESAKFSYPFGVPGADYPVDVWRPANAAGQEVWSSLQLIKNFEDVQTFLSVSADANIGGGAFSVSASGSLTRQFHSTSLGLTAVASVRVHNAELRMGQSMFRPEATAALQLGTRTFARKFGDSYIRQQMMGGHLFLVFQYNARTEDEYRTVSASIAGSLFHTEASVDMESRTEIFREWKRGRMEIYKVGNDDPLPKYDPLNVEQTLGAFLDLVSGFPKSVSYDGGKPYKLGWLISDFQGITNRPNSISLDVRDAEKKKTDFLMARYEQQQAVNDFDLAISDPAFYSPISLDDWARGDADGRDNVKDIDRTLRALGDDPFATPLPGIPQLRKLPALPQFRAEKRPRIKYGAVPNFVGLPPTLIEETASNGQTINESRAGNFGSICNFHLAFDPPQLGLLWFKYMCHFSGVGDRWYDEGETTMAIRGIENIQIVLGGPLAHLYELKIRAYVDNMNWKVGGSGDRFGTTGHNGRIESISIDIQRIDPMKLEAVLPTQRFANVDHQVVSVLMRTGKALNTKSAFTLITGDSQVMHEDLIKYVWAIGNVTIHDDELDANGIVLSGTGKIEFGYPEGQVFP